MKVRGTDFVMYQVSDLARAARFYRETLGLSQTLYSEEWQWAELKGKGALAVGEPVDYSVCCAVEVRDPDGNTVILHKRADGTFG